MKTFEEIYEEIKSNNGDEINNLEVKAKKEIRKASLRGVLGCLIVDAILILLIYLIANKETFRVIYNLFRYIAILDVIVFFWVGSSCSLNNSKEYKKQYKEKIIEKLIKDFFSNVEYFPNDEMPKEIYETADFLELYDSYSSEDYFKAQLTGKYHVQMGEVITTQKEIRANTKGRMRTINAVIFNGFFAQVTMNKSINSELKIVQKKKRNINIEPLRMDSSEFEKYFEVFSDNKIITMQILTADIMQELIEFQNNNNLQFDMSIKDNLLYLRFHTGGIFEPLKKKNGAMDKEGLERYFNILNFVNKIAIRIINIVETTDI